jgi:hypothetical protein
MISQKCLLVTPRRLLRHANELMVESVLPFQTKKWHTVPS